MYMEVKHTQGPDITSLYPANTGGGEVMSQRLEGMVWRWGKGKTYSGVHVQALLGEMSCQDDMPLKGNKDELGPLGACHEGQEERERESTRIVADKSVMASKQRKQSSLSGGTARTGKWWWLSDWQTSKWSARTPRPDKGC